MPIELVRRIIAETLSRFGRSASYDDYRVVAKKLFPYELDAMATNFERQGFVKWIKDGMRQIVNVDESDPDAPTVQLDLLPGISAPAYLNIGSMVAPKLIEFADATVQDLRTVIATRITVNKRISARIEDLQLKLEWLRSNAEENETVRAVCSRLAAKQAAA